MVAALSGCSAHLGTEDGAAAGKRDGQREGTLAGGNDGFLQGSQHGHERAISDARQGAFWEIYVRPTSAAVAFGMFVGLLMQYGILALLRRYRISESMAVFFVPAMCESQAFSQWTAKRKLDEAFARQLHEQELNLREKVQQIEGLKELVEEHLTSRGEIDDLRLRQLVAAFENTAVGIIDEARKRLSDDKKDTLEGA